MEAGFEDTRVQFFFAIAILSGMMLVALSYENLGVGVRNALSGDFHTTGVYEMEIDTGRCEFHPPEHQMPTGLDTIAKEQGDPCAEPYREYVLERRIELINSSTDDERVSEVLSEARKQLASGSLQAAEETLSGVEVERSYTVSGQ